MAIANRTRDLIERTMRSGPGSHATEIVTALNNAALTTVVSKDSINALKKHVGQAAGHEIFLMLKTGSKTNVAAARGEDAYLRNALFSWLKDRDASNDVFTQIATVV